VTGVELAAHLDLSPRALRDYQERGVVPRGADYDTARVAYIRHLRARAAGQASEDGLDLAGERARLASEQADSMAMKNALQRGEQAAISDLEFAVTSLLSGVRGKLLALPSKLALELAAEGDPAVCQELIAKGLHEALTEIAEVSVRDLAARRDAPGGEADHRERGEGAPPSDRADGGRVGRGKANGRCRDEPGAGEVEE
jgi:phage terminase Nu1 subunit (DNA packaging protein)